MQALQTQTVLEANLPLKEKLLGFPVAIREKKSEHEAARLALKDAQAAATQLEAEMKVLIAAEISPETGKAEFTNAAMREAELVRRKAENAEYAAAIRFVRRMEESMNAAQFDLERLYDEFRAVRYVVDLTARELAVIAVSDWQGGDRREAGNKGEVVVVEEKQPY